MRRITILGAGSWGMAIAYLLNKNGHTVTLWEFNQSDFDTLSTHRTHPKKLSDFRLANEILLTNDLNAAFSNPEIVILAVPSQALRSVLATIPPLAAGDVYWVNLAKGIENDSLLRMSELITESISVPPEMVFTLSGPSHAEEVVRDLPTAVVCAGCNNEGLDELQQLFSNDTFRVYQSDDLVGVELGGSLKNIIAIAAGICAGMGTGDNTLGALITRGMAEMTRLGVAMRAESETFAGLSGIGDLITTCASKHSRNRFVGEEIGRGRSLDEILKGMAMVAEGVQTTRSGYELARKFDIEMPITNEVYEVLFNNKPPGLAVKDLMTRSLKPEIWQ